MTPEDQIDPRWEESDELAYRIMERDEARAEVLRLRDNLRTIADGAIGDIAEAIRFAEVCLRSSESSSDTRGERR